MNLTRSNDGVDAAISGLVAHIEARAEHQKESLARELHDDLGGLLVAAVMDLAWTEQHLAAPISELQQRLARVRQSLAAAIDMKRKMIEELRPTLLDNVGLFAALRWHIRAVCQPLGVTCIAHVPDEELRFRPQASIALFRIVQEGLANILSQAATTSATLTITVARRALTVRLVSNGAVDDDAARSAETAGLSEGAEPYDVASIRHRAATLGGDFRFNHPPAGGAHMTARFALDKTLTAENTLAS
jgi:two-component system sensor histidine kinase UhpB